MGFSAFKRFGNGFRFSSKPPVGQAIYETLRDGMGAAYETDFGGRQQARLFSQAMCLAAAQYEAERAANNQDPLTADELLPALERDYQVVAPYNATKAERRRVVSARRLTTRGPRKEAIEDALRTLLGADFLRYEPTELQDIESFPAVPGAVGAFARAGAQKKVFRIVGYVSRCNQPVTVTFESLGGTDAPIIGEEYTVDPDSRCPNVEKIRIASVSGSQLTATFTKPHPAGILATRPHPLLISSKRYNRVIVTVEAATDPETRRKINEQMKRQLRGVSQWCIVQEGTFRFGHATRARLNATRLT